MPWDLVFFTVFAASCLICAIWVVISENPVHSAIGLVGTFINVAAIFVMLGAYFLSVLQIIVYTGAVLVLVLFTIMLVDPDKLPSFYVAQPLQRYMSFIIGLVLLLEIGAAIITRTAMAQIGPHTREWIADQGGNVQAIGMVMFSEYALAFEIASLVLSVGVIGAVVIGLPERAANREPFTATTSLGHSRGQNSMLPARPKFETPIDIPDQRYAQPVGERKVVMTASPDDYKYPGETSNS